MGLPEPMTPPDCDLRGMAFMPMDIVRLLDSDFYATTSGDEFKAGLTLWCKSFLQVPAGSLPDDDRILAHLSGAGARWRKLRARSLHGWVKCADGRLYHRTVAEKCCAAWAARLAQRVRTEAARAAKLGRPKPPVTEEHTRSVTDSVTTPVTDSVTTPVTESVTTPVTESVTTPVTESVTGSKGEGEGEGEGEKKKDSPAPPVPSPGVGEKSDRQRLAERTAAAIGVPKLGDLPPPLCGPLMATIDKLLAAKCDWTADIAPALATRPKGGNLPKTPGYWASIAESSRDVRAIGPKPGQFAPPLAKQLHASDKAKRIAAWLERGDWAAGWGPGEGEPDCLIPPESWAEARQQRKAAA